MTNTVDLFVATCDLAGVVRGRGVPGTARQGVPRGGTGWVPANLSLTAFGDSCPGAVFGSSGDPRPLLDSTPFSLRRRRDRGDGLGDQGYPSPTVWPPGASEADLAGTPALPGRLEEAGSAPGEDDTARSWFDERLFATQLAVKHHELDQLAGLPDAQRVPRIAEVY